MAAACIPEFSFQRLDELSNCGCLVALSVYLGIPVTHGIVVVHTRVSWTSWAQDGFSFSDSVVWPSGNATLIVSLQPLVFWTFLEQTSINNLEFSNSQTQTWCSPKYATCNPGSPSAIAVRRHCRCQHNNMKNWKNNAPSRGTKESRWKIGGNYWKRRCKAHLEAAVRRQLAIPWARYARVPAGSAGKLSRA